MKTIEINSEENVVCPICKQITLDVKTENPVIIPCAHLVYAATDVSLEYRSVLVNELFEIDPDEENCDLGLNDIIEHADFNNVTNNGKLKGLIQFESYDPAPSFMGAYYGYIQNQ